jgi:hypothetical protein
MKREELTVTALTVASLFASGWLVGASGRQISPKPLPQVVLSYDHREAGLDVVRVPATSVVVLGLAPLNEQAPLPPGTLMLCRPENIRIGLREFEGRQWGERDEILFRCGSKRYMFSKMDIQAGEVQ